MSTGHNYDKISPAHRLPGDLELLSELDAGSVL